MALVWPQLEKQRSLKKTYMMLEGLQVAGWRVKRGCLGPQGGAGKSEVVQGKGGRVALYVRANRQRQQSDGSGKQPCLRRAMVTAEAVGARGPSGAGLRLRGRRKG